MVETKRKDSEWKENLQVIEALFQKPVKLLQKEKKQVVQIVDEKFPTTETAGETIDKLVSQISHLNISLLRCVHSQAREKVLDARLV
jgi:hypothetical protein